MHPQSVAEQAVWSASWGAKPHTLVPVAPSDLSLGKNMNHTRRVNSSSGIFLLPYLLDFVFHFAANNLLHCASHYTQGWLENNWFCIREVVFSFFTYGTSNNFWKFVKEPQGPADIPHRLLPARRGETSEGESGGCFFCSSLLHMTHKHTEKEHEGPFG